MLKKTIVPENDNPFSEQLVFETVDGKKTSTRKIHLWKDYFFAANVPILSLKFNNLASDEKAFSLYRGYRLRDDFFARGINALDSELNIDDVGKDGLYGYERHMTQKETFLPAGSLLLRRYFVEESLEGFFQWFALRPDEQKLQNLSRVGLIKPENNATLSDVLKYSIRPNTLRFVPASSITFKAQKTEMRQLWGADSHYRARHLLDIEIDKKAARKSKKKAVVVEHPKNNIGVA